MICVATSSGSYGALGLLHYAEAFATPRPFAEAGVLAALAALLAGRKSTAMLFLLLAALFHPIMALGVLGRSIFICAPKTAAGSIQAVVGGFAVALAALLGRRWCRASCSASIWSWLIVLRMRCSDLFPTMLVVATGRRIVVPVDDARLRGDARRRDDQRLFWSVLGPESRLPAYRRCLGDLYPVG